MNPKNWDLVVATTNRGKFSEFQSAFSNLLIRLHPLWEFSEIPPVIEDGNSFRENALKKAREISRQTGLPTLADDSGLEVEALGKNPGVHSARYAGLPCSALASSRQAGGQGEKATDQQNLGKLLLEMKEIPVGRRQARYTCVLVVRFPDAREFVVEESCEGEISEQPRGSGGFGYDPIFFLPEFGKTMAELPVSLKNQLSHRGKAVQKLVELLRAEL